ncbi:MAG: hypothetical protein WKF68_14550 [Daejeonella sp.]
MFFHSIKSSTLQNNATELEPKPDFEHVIQSIKNQLVKPETYITHRADFNNVKERFGGWIDPKNSVIKAIVEFE